MENAHPVAASTIRARSFTCQPGKMHITRQFSASVSVELRSDATTLSGPRLSCAIGSRTPRERSLSCCRNPASSGSLTLISWKEWTWSAPVGETA